MTTSASQAFDPVRISYVFIALALVLVGWLHLATPLITVLFCSFALRRLSFGGSKWLGLALFSFLFVGMICGAVVFSKRAGTALPKIASETIPVMLDFAEKRGVVLPFADYQTLKDLLLNKVAEKLSGLGLYARDMVVEFVSFVIGVVVAVSLFLNARTGAASAARPAKGDNLYSATFREIMERFRVFYGSFATVMGAQILISMINTLLTAAFLYWNEYRYATVIVGLTFLFGLLPILGNLLSNTLIISVGFTMSPQMALTALVFLVVIHKLEYFLNSKIIGGRIENPMWLTLIGLVVGEKLMGIPGMILAPVILHYIKVEASRSPVNQAFPAAAQRGF